MTDLEKIRHFKAARKEYRSWVWGAVSGTFCTTANLISMFSSGNIWVAAICAACAAFGVMIIRSQFVAIDRMIKRVYEAVQ